MSASTSTLQNPSIYLYGPGVAKLEDAPLPTIKDPHDVIVRIAYIGVCGSDVHFYTHGGIQTKVTASNPLILGHEATGTVITTGPLVTALSPGDLVALEPSLPCRTCSPCKHGTYHLCASMKFASSPSPTLNHGYLTKLTTLPSDFCYKLPPNITAQQGVLIEPLAVAVHVAHLGAVKLGSRVVIFGAGTVGLLLAGVCKALGASAIVSVDINQERLDFARAYAATATFLPLQTQTALEIATGICTQNVEQSAAQGSGLEEGGTPVDIVLEATGAEKCIEAGILALKMGGVFVQAGLGKEKLSAFPIVKVVEKEISLRGSFRYGPGDFEMAVRLLREGRVNVNGFVGEAVPFERAEEAWVRTREGVGIKNLIEGVRD